MNVLKPHQKGAVITLLENEVSQHEISRKTGVDRKTVRKLALAMAAARVGGDSNSPMATGSWGPLAASHGRVAGARPLGL